MPNLFSVKKYIALIIPSFMTVIGFIIGLKTSGFWVGLLVFAIVLLVGVFIGVLLLKNPFTDMIEGKGILAFDFSSTGIINPFICKIQDPYIVNDKKKVTDIFDREIVYNLSPPVVADGSLTKNEDGSLTVHLTKEDFNRSRFGMFHYPVLIYNSLIKSFLTKDFLSGQEKIAFAEHSILYQNQKLAELSSAVRDFGRYIVEMTKPAKDSFFKSKWVWIIILVGIVLVGLLFAPSVYNTVAGAVHSGASAINSSVGAGSIITVR